VPEVPRVALTGGIATGKSYVRAWFERAGVPTIDADVLARQAVAPGSAGLASVVRRFGTGLLTPDGELDRRALGAIVFADPAARRDLEAIVHPEVRRATDAWFAALDPVAHVFALADIPLLYETGRDRDFRLVVVTSCAVETQLARLMRRDALSEADARARIAAQLPLDEKRRRADFVIETDGTFAETDARVRDVHGQLLATLRP
jgi:dephospho-CoA kinase